MDLTLIQEKIGYTFKDQQLLITALVHRSYLNEKNRDETIKNHNERLEFLGDAVLELIVTDYLYKKTHENEGVLTAIRSSLVNYKQIGKIGVNLGFETEILLSKGEREELGKARLTIVADSVEAVIGAMYLDGGMEPCIDFINNHLFVYLPEIMENQTYKDYKTLVQELCQKYTKITPHYRLISSEGKDHEKVFTIGLWVGPDLVAKGIGRSKQDAETEAAKDAIEILKNQYQI